MSLPRLRAMFAYPGGLHGEFWREVYRLTGDSQDGKQWGDVRLDLLELVGDALSALAGACGGP